jgi:hypothetical protein
MRNRHGRTGMFVLLSLPFFLSPVAYAQLVRDPQQDISVSFSSRHQGEDPGTVFGVATNNSANAYPCVRIEFDLYTRFDLRTPGQEGRLLGVLPVELQNLRPREARAYQHQLPQPAGIGLKSVTECPKQPAKELPDAPKILSFSVVPPRIQAGQTATLQWRTENTDHILFGERNPEWPRTSQEPILAPRAIEPSGSVRVSPSQTVTYRLEAKKEGRSTLQDVTLEVTSSPSPPGAPAPAGTCSITGRISGNLQWNTRDDRGQPISFTLEHIYLKAPGVTRPERAKVQGRTYIFENLTAGQTYTISPGGFRSQPRERVVSCRSNTTHRGVDFEITGAPPSG